MANIIDTQAIRYVNEVVRVRAEQLRALKALIDSDLQTWSAISSKFPNDTSLLDDKRETEGVSRLTGADINTFIAILNGIQARFNLAGVATNIDKPCVRVLEVK